MEIMDPRIWTSDPRIPGSKDLQILGSQDPRTSDPRIPGSEDLQSVDPMDLKGS
jgi:hypothetical protein